MTVRSIITYPNPILRQISQSIESPGNEETKKLVIDLCETMDASGHSVGIAAPQIGKLQRIVVIDCSSKVKKSLGRLIMINPEIVESEGSYTMREGCMSLPDYVGQVTRPRRITVKALNEEGEEFEVHAKKFEAVVIQHEIDHLDGIVFIDRISSLKKDLLRRSELFKKI